MSELKDHAIRAHALLSASSAARWLKCPPSAVAAAMYPNKSTAYTQEGTVAHEVAEAVTRARLDGVSPEVAADDRITQEMINHAGEYADYIQEQTTDPEAVVLLEQRLDFSPWVPDGFGTGDCLILQGSTLDVIDYKYGKGVEVSAKENPQMRLYALGALNEFGLIYDIETIRTHIFQPRISNISTEVISRAKLEAWGDQIRPIAEQASKGKGRHVAGEHCRWCPHAGDCPTLARKCSRAFDVSGGKAAVPGLAPFQVAEVLAKSDLISHWLTAVKDRALADMLNGQEIPGYKLVEGKLGNRAWTNEDQVFGTLKDAGFAPEEITETKLLSPAKMDKALGKKVVAEKLSDLISRSPGAPTVVPASDKRPAYNRAEELKKDFD